MKSHFATVVYLILVVVLFFAFDFHNILNKRPQGIHQWRQSDCLSITHNFYNGNADFLKPRIHNQSSTGGHAISEFPVLYYLNGMLWKAFGKHEWISRLVNLFFWFLGLMALYKILELILEHKPLSVLISLICLTSPIYAYYANNFLSNVPALSMSLIGIWFFVLFIRGRSGWFLLAYFVVFTLAGLIKATGLFGFCLISIIIFAEGIGFKGTSLNVKAFYRQYLIGTFLLSATLIGWYAYAYSFNSIHGSGAFLVGILPIWELSANEIILVWQEFKKYWLNDTYKIEILVLSFISMIVSMIVFIVRKNHVLLIGLLALIFGFAAYLALWFQVYNEHDYYLIDALLVIMILLALGGAHLVKVINHSRILKMSVYISLVALLIHSAIHAQYRVRLRYRGWMNRHHLEHFKALENIEPQLRATGISPSDLVLSVPDESINSSLYLMNQRGWTNYGHELDDSTAVLNKIKAGAKYLVVNNQNELKGTFWMAHMKNQVLLFENIGVYKLATE